MIKRHLAAWLKDDPELRQAVDGRIFPGRARQGNRMPYILLQTSSGAPFNDLPGEPDYTRSLIAVVCYDKTDRAVTELSEKIRQRMSGYRGFMGDMYVSGCALSSSPQSFTNRPIDGSDNWTFVSSTDYDMVYSQALTTNC